MVENSARIADSSDGSDRGGGLWAQESVLIVTSELEPYISLRNGGSGLVFDLVKQAFAEVNRPVTIQFYPWKRAEMMVAAGEAYAAIPYIKNEERAKTYNFSEPLVFLSYKFLYNKEKFPQGFTWTKLEDFRGYTIGGGLGWYYLSAFEQAGLKVEAVVTEWQNLQKLLAQRIDFTVLDEITTYQILREKNPEAIDKIGFCEKPESIVAFHLLISRKYPHTDEISAAFQQGLARLKEKGAYQQLFEQYQIPKDMLVP